MNPGSRMYLTRTADDGVTTVVFGNGVRGMRLPTGVGNVTANYRNGIGRGGNVKAGQISQLLSRPLGVKGVSNPIEASGGADRETLDQARKNAPLAVMALDRLVATRDYADLSRTFAGIGKASAARISSGGAGGVHVTIAGADDIPIRKTDDLYRNLSAALRTFGDPSLAVHVELRELMLLVLSARVRINAVYLWDDVVARVRASLLDRYSFERQELGQSIVLSEVISLIQSQRGVDFVDVDALGAVTQFNASGELRSPQDIAKAMGKVVSTAAASGRPAAFVPVAGIRVSDGAVLPAQICFFIPSLLETLLLNRIED
jgi:predicted phage baseplate assembly protein